ncbi:hypothetical protein, partial [Endozoicomonas sp. SESOKO2]
DGKNDNLWACSAQAELSITVLKVRGFSLSLGNLSSFQADFRISHQPSAESPFLAEVECTYSLFISNQSIIEL